MTVLARTQMGRAGRGVLAGTLLVLALASFTPEAAGQTLPNYGFEWATITKPGNRNANAAEAPGFHPPISNPAVTVGRVDYVYRMATTEVTVGNWLEFVKAYYPFHPNQLNGRIQGAFTGGWIFARNRNLNKPPEFYLEPGSDNYATDMSWRYAARYANWLHNGKVNEKWAFENGAYDTSTFTDNPDGTFNDQIKHSPDAKFWIPTMNEWIKANHYDPDRYGPGEEGYWTYNSSSNVELIGGPPGSPGAQTDAGRWGDPFTWFPVGSYPDVQSPWGLLGGSGTVLELTETLGDTSNGPRDRVILGSARRTSLVWDRIDTARFGHPGNRQGGLRIASVVPSPAAFALLGSASLVLVSRRRRK
jgi:Sulfatase-modifying factor enzyme 1